MKEEKKYGKITMYQGTSDLFQGSTDLMANLESLKQKIRELFNLKNVNFLFGSGTSSGAIPTMSELYSSLSFSPDEAKLKEEFQRIVKKSGDNGEGFIYYIENGNEHWAIDQCEGIDQCDRIQLAIDKIREIVKSYYAAKNLNNEDENIWPNSVPSESESQEIA